MDLNLPIIDELDQCEKLLIAGLDGGLAHKLSAKKRQP
jgi:hypothetical protein